MAMWYGKMTEGSWVLDGGPENGREKEVTSYQNLPWTRWKLRESSVVPGFTGGALTLPVLGEGSLTLLAS